MADHLQWLKDNNIELQTANAVKVKLLDFIYEPDEAIMGAWAKHFREHYCTDGVMDSSRAPMGLSRSEYLEQIKFPDRSSLGSGTRSADFSEILVADYLNYALNYYVPRTRYDDKKNKNTSPQGIDVVGFKIMNYGTISSEDELITCEVKASLGSRADNDTLKKAINGSKNDYHIKTPEALNAIRQRLKDRGEEDAVNIVERFQNIVDKPHKRISGAAAVHSNNTWSNEVVTSITVEHPNENLFLVAIKGEALLNLAHNLYQKAQDEA